MPFLAVLGGGEEIAPRNFQTVRQSLRPGAIILIEGNGSIKKGRQRGIPKNEGQEINHCQNRLRTDFLRTHLAT